MFKTKSKELTSSEDELEDMDEAEIKEDEEEDNTTEEGEESYSPSNSFKKLCIAHKSIDEIGWNRTKAVSLAHPRTEAKALFLVDFSENKSVNLKSGLFFVYEILTMADPLRSWFVNETVISNGNLYTFTPMDPLFLILPTLAKTTKAMPFSDHLTDAFPPDVARVFCNRISPKQLKNISIKKVCGDIEAYAYSEELTLSWLSKKVKKTSQFLSKKGINTSEVSVSVNFTKSSSNTEEVKEDSEIKVEYLQYACDIVGDYINDALKKKLLTKFGFPTEPERSKRKNNDFKGEDGIEGNNKKLKVTDNVQPLEDYGTNSPNSISASKITGRGKAKEKELQKAAQGTRSLLSFFTSKTKKS